MTATAHRPTSEAPSSRPSHAKRNSVIAAASGGVFIAGAFGGVTAYNAATSGPEITTANGYETTHLGRDAQASVLGATCLQASPDGRTFMVMSRPVTVEGAAGPWGVLEASQGGVTLVRFAGTTAVCAAGGEGAGTTGGDLAANLPPLQELDMSTYAPSAYPDVPRL